MARTNYDDYAFLAWKKNSSYGYTVTTQLYGRWLLQGREPVWCKTEHGGGGVPGTDGSALHFWGQRGVAKGPHSLQGSPSRCDWGPACLQKDPSLWPPSWRHGTIPLVHSRGAHPGVAGWGCQGGLGFKGKGRLRPQSSCLP